MEKHTNAAVLDACARLASCLCSDCYTFSSRAHTAFGQLLDRLTEYFNSYLNDLLQVKEVKTDGDNNDFIYIKGQ